MNLPGKIKSLNKHLVKAELPHAFGGALALAWCTERARGTIDIDINIFVAADQNESIFKVLPKTIKHTAEQRNLLRDEGQVRVWWENTPVDIFLNTTDFHNDAAKRVHWESFAGATIPFLSCNDIAVFKAFFNRTKDWADLEEMKAAETLNINKIRAELSKYLGNDDVRIEKLLALDKL